MNVNGDVLLTLALECEPAISLVAHCLEEGGMQVVRSFDLQSACASFSDPICPHHRDGPCDCQLVVLLVYGSMPYPNSLIVHTHHGHTEFEVAPYPDHQPHPELLVCMNRLSERFEQAVNLGENHDG